jgi:hypothetical protein
MSLVFKADIAVAMAELSANFILIERAIAVSHIDHKLNS